MCFPDHLTIEVIETMGTCKRIFTNLDEIQLGRLSEEFRGKCVSLWSLYRDDRSRGANYQDVIQSITETVVRESPVAWLTPGHPLVLDSVSRGLQKAGRAHGWKVRIMPGLSCIDTLLADLDYDPASGLLVHDSTAVVSQRIPLISSIATLLLQPHVFGSDLPRIYSNSSPDLRALCQYLLGFYPKAHRCAFVRSACAPGGSCEITWVDLADMAGASFESVRGSSLFLPAVNRDPQP